MCTVLLPLGGYPIAVNKCIILRHTKFHGNLPGRRGTDTCGHMNIRKDGETDGHDEANRRSLRLLERE